jgi:hypothetical protein
MRLFKLPLLIIIALMAFTGVSLAQTKKSPKRIHVKVAKIAPRTEDVATLDGIIAAFYDVISGPAGKPRQWSRDRTLYIPEIKFLEPRRSKGQITSLIMDHQSYVDRVDAPMIKDGFFEREIHRATQTFGNITHVYSTYESRNSVDGPVIARGINSIELLNDGKRWWITFAQWDDEGPNNPIPKEFLP